MKIWMGGIALAAVLLHAVHAEPQPAPAKSDRPASVHGGRRAVMNGLDADSGRVKSAPVKTTIEKLLDQPRPLDLGISELNPDYAEHRVPGVETTTWELDAQIENYQLMPDGDFKVTLKGESGRKIVMELPDPKLAPKSRWARELAEVRKQFEEKLHPTTELKQASVRARITGIGFFGKPMQRGAEENQSGVQLHPVVKLEWLPDAPAGKPAPEQAAPATSQPKKS